MSDFCASLVRQRKPVASKHGGTLKRVLHGPDLVLIGLGNIVGGGIYIMFGVAVHLAGPAVTVSFAATGVAATCSALCYAEFAARIPEAGSAYAFTYHVIGEFLAWHVAWAMALEMITGLAAVSLGWSNYTRSFLAGSGFRVPWMLEELPFGEYFKLDVMSICFIVLLTTVVSVGITESKWVNHVATAVKVGILLFVILFAFGHADTNNWTDFSPNGSIGVVQASATVMFAFTGFEVVAQCAEETAQPEKAMPVGIVGSVAASTLIYVLVSASVTLMVPWSTVDLKAPLAMSFKEVLPWMVPIVSSAAVIGLFAIGLGNVLASSRLLMGLGRDGLLPHAFSAVNEASQTPVVATVLVGCMAIALTLAFPYRFLTEMVSVGTMFAFTIVCVDLVATRCQDEARPGLLPGLIIIFLGSSFAACFAHQHSWWSALAACIVIAIAIGMYLTIVSKTPLWATDHFVVPGGGTVVACVGIAMNSVMTASLEAALHWNLVWFAIGWVIYFAYGRQNSRAGLPEAIPLVSCL